MIKLVYNQNEMSIDISFPYDPNDTTILDLVKLLPDRVFHGGDKKFWRVPIQAGVNLEGTIREFVIDCQTYSDETQLDERIYPAIIEVERWKADNYILSRKMEYSDGFSHKPLDALFKGILTAPQKIAAYYMFRNARGVINGNSEASRRIETLAALELSQDWPYVITCPNNQKFIWASRVKLITGRPVLIVGEEQEIIEYTRGTRDAAQVVICNFGNLYKNDWLFTMNWRALVVDGSHFIKNRDSDQAKLLFELARDCPHKYLLSDSDFATSPISVLVQLELIDRLQPVFGGRTKFLTRYQSMKQTNDGWHLGGAAYVDELDKLMRENCYIQNEVKDEKD